MKIDWQVSAYDEGQGGGGAWKYSRAPPLGEN